MLKCNARTFRKLPQLLHHGISRRNVHNENETLGENEVKIMINSFQVL